MIVSNLPQLAGPVMTNVCLRATADTNDNSTLSAGRGGLQRVGSRGKGHFGTDEISVKTWIQILRSRSWCLIKVTPVIGVTTILLKM